MACFPDLSEEIGEVVYRYNAASVRIRVVSQKFEGKNEEERERLVMEALRGVPKDIQDDITMILMYTPDDAENTEYMMREFDDPSISRL
jgi:hypothetical protein